MVEDVHKTAFRLCMHDDFHLFIHILYSETLFSLSFPDLSLSLPLPPAHPLTHSHFFSFLPLGDGGGGRHTNKRTATSKTQKTLL